MLSNSVTPQVVRAAVPADASALAPLCAAHAAYERLPYSAAGHAERLLVALASGQLHAWLLEQGGSPMGYASVTLDFATLSGQRYAHLDCLYLTPAARNQGGGLALMQAVQAYARAQGSTTLQWQTPAWNRGAMRFYARLGARAYAKQRYTLALDGVGQRIGEK
ncbi:GNAT superfamily N-acetyltransferase [Rhodoferax saidenbachensis]|uniref:GNAT superfamily N-acetyltransferase n=1 Tax=Rhodoferax saidenbachensis TaxID=1484693 RepID=A0ABU1ZQ77_9BURK|nr:GNAT superfamily N-acetyltransferase [Rhodoferax saidenbachensis]